MRGANRLARIEMTFEQLLHRVQWEDVAQLIPRWPYDTEDLDGYRQVFEHLKRLVPVPTTMRIVVLERFGPRLDEEPVVEVTGRNGQLNRDQDDFQHAEGRVDEPWANAKTDFALDFTPWEEWLAMEVAKTSLEVFTEAKIVAHSLWEMTFHGFDEEQVQQTLAELKRRVEEFDAMTKEERKRAFIPMEEVLRRLGNE